MHAGAFASHLSNRVYTLSKDQEIPSTMMKTSRDKRHARVDELVDVLTTVLAQGVFAPQTGSIH